MQQPFGGPWTKEKLAVLAAYLNAYTTALKNQPFDLVYLDAFAGNGYWRPKASDSVYDGSPRIALKIGDKSFDKVVLIEKDPANCDSLRALHGDFPRRNIVIRNGDANEEVARFCSGMPRNERAVVFLDPFALEVRWQTLEALAQTQKMDCWILFPRGAVARMMQRNGEPRPRLKTALDITFGGRERWEPLYSQSPHVDFSGARVMERNGGSEEISRLFRNRLESIFAKVLSAPRVLRNSRGSPIFELFFAVSNERAVKLAAKIVGQANPPRPSSPQQRQPSLGLDL